MIRLNKENSLSSISNGREYFFFHYIAKSRVAGAISGHHIAPTEDRVRHSCSPLNARDEHPGARSLLNFHPRCNGGCAREEGVEGK